MERPAVLLPATFGGYLIAQWCWENGANVPQGLTIAIVGGFAIFLAINMAIDLIHAKFGDHP